MKSLSSADVAASKGHAPPIDPRLVVKDVMGRPVGVWSGKVVSK
jgi:hypothetical protein